MRALAKPRRRAGALSVLLAVAVGALPGWALAGTAAKAKPKAPYKVTVLEYEFGFRLSHTTVPAGKVTFVMANVGTINHNFDIIGVKEGPFLVPDQRASMTVTLKKGHYTYVCSVKYHASEGMQGTLIVK